MVVPLKELFSPFAASTPEKLGRRLSEFLCHYPCDREKILQLIALGADLKTQYPGGETLVLQAATHDDPAILQAMFDKGADKNEKGAKGRTLMMCAASHGCAKVVSLLLEMGAPVDERDDGGGTALMCAAANACRDVVKVLLDARADIDIRSNEGRTAIDCVQSYIYGDECDFGSDNNDDHGTLSLICDTIRERKDWLPRVIAEIEGGLKKDIGQITPLTTKNKNPGL